MKVDMAVNLKSISTTSVTLSYAYSDTALDTISSTSNIFECQRISPNATKYIYIVVTPTSTRIPSSFSSSVVFYQGELGEFNVVVGGETIFVENIVKGQPVYEPSLDMPSGYEFGGWYLDKDYKTKVTFPLRNSGSPLYAKLNFNRDAIYNLNGTVDSEGYTLYGAYPQDYVGNTLNTTLKNALSAGTLNSTGWTYTTDINGTETILQEYEYNGDLYTYLPSSQDSMNNTATFNDDGATVIGNGNSYFFKVEPLQWKIINGKFMCNYVLGSMAFDNSEELLWQNSDIRTYLNEVFYIESGINKVKTTKTTILNNSKSSTDDGSGANTQDYIWLFSYDEWNAEDYMKGGYRSLASDFARATYTAYSNMFKSGYHWSRSVMKSSTNNVTYDYYIYYYAGSISALQDASAKYNAAGFCPCFSLD